MKKTTLIKTICLGLTTVGVVGQGVSSNHDAINWLDYKSRTKEFSNLSKFEKIKAYAKTHWRSLSCGAVAIVSSGAGFGIGIKEVGALTGALALSQQAYSRFEVAAKKVVGAEKVENIKKEAASLLKTDIEKTNPMAFHPDNLDGKELFYEEHIGYFKAKMEDVVNAMNLLQEVVMGVDVTGEGCETDSDYFNQCKFTLQDFLDFVNADYIYTDSKCTKGIKNTQTPSLETAIELQKGWSWDKLNEYKTQPYVSFNIKKINDKDGVVYNMITFVDEPTFINDEQGD